MKIEELYKLYSEYYLIDTDTRKIRNNTLFFALKGVNFNGNEFAEEALFKGASYSIVDQEQYVTNNKIILVDDVLETLHDLARYHRIKLNIPILAITGSNGKTTTKELINAVLSKKYKTIATVGNLNNHIGVPLTLMSMDFSTELGIVEMGANHPKEIAFLASIASPDFGYITNFGKAHLEGFGSIEGVVKAKSELYDYLIENNKVVFVNQLDEIQLEKTKKSNRVFFDDTIEFLEVNPFVKLIFEGLKTQSNLIGKYNFDNIAASITIGKYFGVSKQQIKRAIENYIPTNNRSQIIEKGSNKLILDAYNANPTSMKVALENFNLIPAKQKVVILGDMFELGNSSIVEHQHIVDLIKSYKFDDVFLFGENFIKTKSEFNTFKKYEELSDYLQKSKIQNTHVLIKGSRGTALERVLAYF